MKTVDLVTQSEADLWNPNSSPYSTHIAINILEEIKFRDRNHDIIKKILKYLEATSDFDGEYWTTIISSNKNYPHAPWWADSTYDWGYTPTALFAGFILFYANQDGNIYKKAEKIVEVAINKYLFGTMQNGEAYNSVRREGEIQCFTKMLTFLENTEIGHKYNIAETKRVLKKQAGIFIEKDDFKVESVLLETIAFHKIPGQYFLLWK